jgi:hypothetical protein
MFFAFIISSLLSACSPFLDLFPRERQVRLWSAYALEEVPAYLEAGKTTTDDVINQLGHPWDLISGDEIGKEKNRPDEIWYYYPTKRELVYKIAYVDSKGEIYNLRFAPSNGRNLVLRFKKMKLISVATK